MIRSTLDWGRGSKSARAPPFFGRLLSSGGCCRCVVGVFNHVRFHANGEGETRLSSFGVGPSRVRCPDATAAQNYYIIGVQITTLGGGSLGSCVDEERSQLRELM